MENDLDNFALLELKVKEFCLRFGAISEKKNRKDIREKISVP